MVLLVLIVAVGAFLYFPRGEALAAVNSAVLSVLSSGVDAQRSAGQQFEPALDGDVFATGDQLRADADGQGLLTFFDGSTVTVDPLATLKVTSLNKPSSGGIQALLEQTAGRTWTSVTKLATPDSKFEIKTPSLTATVRGTTFEIIVEILPDGSVRTTVRVTEGEVLVTALDGTQVIIRAGQQGAVEQGESAPPAGEPSPPTPRLRIAAPAGAGFVVIDPRGLRCGSLTEALERQVPRCDVGSGGGGQVVTIGDVVAGDYQILLAAARALSGAELVAEGIGLGGSDFTSKVPLTLAVGDLVRTTLPVRVSAEGKLSSTGLTPPEKLSTVCGAEAAGRVFSSGDPAARTDLLLRYGEEAPDQPAALVITSQELTDAAATGLQDAQLPVELRNVAIDIDGAGVHFSGSVQLGPFDLSARGDVIAGQRDGKLLVKIRTLDSPLLPSAIKGQIIEVLEQTLDEVAADFPLYVQRVAFRSGCIGVIGRTPA